MPDIGRDKPCLGHGDQPCPRAAVVRTRYAKRCSSCAAKQRKFEAPWLYTYQLRKAREKSPNFVTKQLREQRAV